MQKQRCKGFTIIELLVVMAILAILAAIAIPQYIKYVTDARRTDGKAALVVAAQRMERHFTNCHTFMAIPGRSDCLGVSLSATSERGYYALTVTAANATSFTIQATAQGKQAGDMLCAMMTINHLGRKTPPDCW